MALSKLKRAYLVKHIGEDRVAAIEKALEEKEAELKAAGIAFKSLDGATSFAELEKVLEVSDLKATFDGIVQNIMHSSDMDAAETVVKLKAAVTEFGKRLSRVGSKAMNVLNPRPRGAGLPDTPGGRALASMGFVGFEVAEKETDAPAELPDTPGGRALAQIFGKGGAS